MNAEGQGGGVAVAVRVHLNVLPNERVVVAQRWGPHDTLCIGPRVETGVRGVIGFEPEDGGGGCSHFGSAGIPSTARLAFVFSPERSKNAETRIVVFGFVTFDRTSNRRRLLNRVSHLYETGVSDHHAIDVVDVVDASHDVERVSVSQVLLFHLLVLPSMLSRSLVLTSRRRTRAG